MIANISVPTKAQIQEGIVGKLYEVPTRIPMPNGTLYMRILYSTLQRFMFTYYSHSVGTSPYRTNYYYAFSLGRSDLDIYGFKPSDMVNVRVHVQESTDTLEVFVDGMRLPGIRGNRLENQGNYVEHNQPGLLAEYVFHVTHGPVLTTPELHYLDMSEALGNTHSEITTTSSVEIEVPLPSEALWSNLTYRGAYNRQSPARATCLLDYTSGKYVAKANLAIDAEVDHNLQLDHGGQTKIQIQVIPTQ